MRSTVNFSRSIVVRPGRTMSRRAVKTSQTIKPARCILASSSADFSWMGIVLLGAAKNIQPPSGHRWHIRRSIHILQHALAAVIGDQRLGLLFIRRQPRGDHFFAIIRPDQQLAAVVIATAGTLRRT